MKDKKVFLTSRRWDKPSLIFRKALEQELISRGVNVYSDAAFDVFNFYRRHHTYDISIAIDFHRDDGNGCSLTLNRNSTPMSRDFAFAVSDNLDLVLPSLQWRSFDFVDSMDVTWYKFFNKVSSDVKVLFYLCTYTNPVDWELYSVAFKDVVNIFADEIVRCLQSNRSNKVYNEAIKLAKERVRKYNREDG